MHSIDIADYLLKHSDSLREEFNITRHNKRWTYLPPFIIHLYEASYKKELLSHLIKACTVAFNTSYDEIAIVINEKYINILLGNNYLYPPKEGT